MINLMIIKLLFSVYHNLFILLLFNYTLIPLYHIWKMKAFHTVYKYFYIQLYIYSILLYEVYCIV